MCQLFPSHKHEICILGVSKFLKPIQKYPKTGKNSEDIFLSPPRDVFCQKSHHCQCTFSFKLENYGIWIVSIIIYITCCLLSLPQVFIFFFKKFFESDSVKAVSSLSVLAGVINSSIGASEIEASDLLVRLLYMYIFQHPYSPWWKEVLCWRERKVFCSNPPHSDPNQPSNMYNATSRI